MELPDIKIVRLIGLVILALNWTADAGAHHSFSRFDSSKVVEIEGELVSFSWRNPHVRFNIREVNESGDDIVWNLETNSLSILRRTNASPEGLKVGDKIKVAGWPTVRPSAEIFVLNLLMPDGKELLLEGNGKPRWSTGEILGDKTEWLTGGTATDNTGRQGLFRVWSTVFGPSSDLWTNDYPLTEAGRQKRSEWDPLIDTAAPGCEPKGMPLIMEQPYPMEFVQDDGVILLRMEEYDTVRSINMTQDELPAYPDTSILGYSAGRWDNETLVVVTVGVDFPLFDSNGTPQGSNPSFVERFRVSEDGSRLLYQITATDDEIFTQPVMLERDWVWRPGEQVQPYECLQP